MLCICSDSGDGTGGSCGGNGIQKETYTITEKTEDYIEYSSNYKECSPDGFYNDTYDIRMNYSIDNKVMTSYWGWDEEMDISESKIDITRDVCLTEKYYKDGDK